MDSIGEILPTIPILAQRSKCEKCGKRPPFNDKKWCFICISAYHIEQTDGFMSELIKNNIPPAYHNARVQDLTPPLREQYLLLADWQGLLLWGKQGRGKTYAMMAYAIAFLHSGFTVECVNYDLLCSRIRSSYQAKADETEYDIIKKLSIPDKLFIDDVGVTVTGEKIESDFSLRVFLSIVDQRVNNTKPTFITTNKPIEQLEASFDKRISSRLKQCCQIIQITGKDRRV